MGTIEGFTWVWRFAATGKHRSIKPPSPRTLQPLQLKPPKLQRETQEPFKGVLMIVILYCSRVVRIYIRVTFSQALKCLLEPAGAGTRPLLPKHVAERPSPEVGWGSGCGVQGFGWLQDFGI